MPRQIQGSQNDFSFGEVDPDLKRCDGHPARKAGLRQMLNARIHSSGTIQNRSGRSALFPSATSWRIEEFTITPGSDFKIAFGLGEIRIFNSAGAQVRLFTTQGNGAALPWTSGNVNQIVYAVFGLQIFLTFGFAMRPQVITFDGVATWSIADYVELITGTQKRTPFYRISPQGITIAPSAQTGNITVIASGAVFTPGSVGTRIRFVNRQILITGFTNTQQVSATVQQPLPGSQQIAFATDPASVFTVGDVILGSVSGSRGLISNFPGANTISVQLLSINATSVNVVTSTGRPDGTNTFSFIATDVVAGPGGSLVPTSVSTISPPVACAIWDEEVMNNLRGYPASCFVDQFRLGFCDFPSLPGGIAWSAINFSADLYANDASSPSNSIFEIAPNKVRIYYVVPGPEGSEFVFCDRRVYYIPINENNPLKPGSVAFKTLSGDGSARVRPHIAQEAVLYVNAGSSTIMAAIATGAYQRPFSVKSLTDFHEHLFDNVQCIAAPNADATFNERYAYVLNGDGTIVVGKYQADSLVSNAPVIGWGPWSGVATVKWIHAWGQDVLMTSSYFGATICEVLDDTVYMDAALSVNALPAPFTPPGGKGPLWWIPSQSVFLMDQGTRPMGVYQIDANGFIVPQNNGGENLAAASLVAGQIWSGAAEPFAPDAPSGADQHQRMELRQYSYFGVYVIHSTGLVFASLFSGKQTRTGLVPGAVVNSSRRPSYNMDEDTTVPPYQRETVEKWTPQGSSFDPRCVVLWDTPGPIQILEFAMEIST